MLPNSAHITCYTHIMNLDSDQWRMHFSDVNRVIGCFKKLFKHYPARKHRFIDFLFIGIPRGKGYGYHYFLMEISNFFNRRILRLSKKKCCPYSLIERSKQSKLCLVSVKTCNAMRAKFWWKVKASSKTFSSLRNTHRPWRTHYSFLNM